jgi:glyoxylase-like metal-dependent hydrolase (beta-lactamase superfamily II)
MPEMATTGHKDTTFISGTIHVGVFFEKDTSTLSYVVFDERSLDAVIIDPVLDYDPASGITSENSVSLIIDFVKKKNLSVQMILETHAHADHLSAAQILKRTFPMAKLTIGERIREVQQIFREVYGFEDWFKADGHQFDRLVKDGETFKAGTIEFRCMNTPGHTPACSTWVLNGGVAAFTGDSMFIPDSGTGRCDFPGGSADDMYDSIVNKIYKLPDATRLFVAHDYQPGGRELRWETTVADAKRSNSQVKEGTSREQYIEFRRTRDKTLSAPRLIHPSVQVNINGGVIPPPDSQGRHFLKIPLRSRK